MLPWPEAVTVGPGGTTMGSGAQTSRRSAIGTALAAVGLAGTGAIAKLGFGRGDSNNGYSESEAATPAAAAAPVMPTLYLSDYLTHTEGRSSGSQRKKGDQTLLRGMLKNEAGEQVGEVFASSITMPGPVAPGAPATPRMELQNLQLADGTIMAMGTVFAQDDIANTYTIIGGSGAYAAVRGGYTFDHNPSVASPSGQATITFSLMP